MTTPAPWVELVQLIQNGMNVDAADTNSVLQQLVQRDDYLKCILDLMLASEALYGRAMEIDESVDVGMPVYLDDTDGKLKPAVAAVDFDAAGNYGSVSKSSYVWGIVQSKTTPQIADIVTAGILRNVDMTGIMPDPSVSGAYYLSTSTPGKLTQQKPPVSIYVLYWWADTNTALVMPTPREVLEDHIHYRFELLAEAAGIPNCPGYGDRHAVVAPDPDAEGWLPAAHPVFGGVAPDGAKFGYNIAKDLLLSSVFPPIPANSFYLEVFEGVDGTGRDPSTDVLVDNNGIWWMNDCYGRAPWPVYEEPCSSSSLSGGDCDPIPTDHLEGHDLITYDYAMSIYFWFTKMVFKTDNTVVTKLVPSEGAPIRFYTCGTREEASTGPLEANVNLALSLIESDEAGAFVFKDVVEGSKFKGGYVVEKIKSNSPNLIINASIEEAETGYGKGTLILDFLDPNLNAELDVLLVALNNVRQEEYQGVLYYGMLAGRDSSIRGRLDMSALGIQGNINLKIHMRILGTAAGTMPTLTASYLRVPETDDTPVDLVTGDTALPTINLGTIGAITSNQYVEVETEAFEVAAGDTVFFTIGRASSDVYPGTIGLMRLKGRTSPITEEI